MLKKGDCITAEKGIGCFTVGTVSDDALDLTITAYPVEQCQSDPLGNENIEYHDLGKLENTNQKPDNDALSLGVD